MPLVIETGAPTPGANTYVDAIEFSQYLTDRGYEVPDVIDPFLIRAFDLMACLDWIADHSEAYLVFDSHKRGQCEIAYRISLGADEGATQSAPVKREKVDVLEVEYFNNSSIESATDFLKTMPTAERFLKGLIGDGSSCGYIGRA